MWPQRDGRPAERRSAARGAGRERRSDADPSPRSRKSRDRCGGYPCPAADQRGYARPAAAACDIGAVEYGGQAPEPTPTETPTETTVPEPTPTETVIPADEPAPDLAPVDLPGGVKPTVNVTTDHGYLGQELTVSGDIPEGYDQVRLSVLVNGQTIGSTLARNINGQRFSAPLEIDEQFPVGDVMVCAAVTGEVNAENRLHALPGGRRATLDGAGHDPDCFRERRSTRRCA